MRLYDRIQQTVTLYSTSRKHNSVTKSIKLKNWPTVNEKVYIGHVYENWDCPGPMFSAEPWGDPVEGTTSSSKGLDCMRLCLHVGTCFGISVTQGSCYLKNDACFDTRNLVKSHGTIIAVLRVVREDYHCGCHYPFTRQRSNGSISEWHPQCPASHLSKTKYGCCSKSGLCQSC